MAAVILTAPNDPLVTDADWEALLDEVNTCAKSKNGINLTNWVSGNTSVPAIDSGSYIEINGALVYFNSQTALTLASGLSAGTVYVMIDTTGGFVTPYITNVAPAWNNVLSGWYDSSDNNKKYTGHVMTWNGSTSYSVKKTVLDHDMLWFQYVGASN